MTLMASIAFVFFAGTLSVLSPCVLPILPIVLGGATASHRAGPFALAAGLAISFAAIGLFIATVGLSLGLGGTAFQTVGAILLTLVGLVLLVPALQVRFAAASAPFANWIDNRLGSRSGAGLGAQFGLGVALGAVWSPCAGPTLGAAALLAASGHDLMRAAITMFAFGVGAASPLIALGLISRSSFIRIRGKFASTGELGRVLFGAALMAIGILMLSGINQSIEAWLVEHSPDWLMNLTTRY